jgi:hypothetical protein
VVCVLALDYQGVTMGYPTDLTDAQWAFIEPIFPPQEGRGRLKARRNPHFTSASFSRATGNPSRTPNIVEQVAGVSITMIARSPKQVIVNHLCS